MNQNGKVQYVSIERIKPAPYNPPSRVSHKSIGDIKASIERVGIIYPLVVTKDMDLVDGHRRLECAKMLNMETVPVIVRDEAQADLFSELNTTAKRMTKADDLFVYLSGGAMTGRSKKDIEIIERMAGREMLEYMGENGISPSSPCSVMAHLMNYIGKNNPMWNTGENKFANKTIRWLILRKQQFKIRAALVNRTPPAAIIAFIEADEPIV